MLAVTNTQHRFSEYGAGNDNQFVFAAIDRAIDAAMKVPVAGGERIELSLEGLQGAWSLRFGRFGCPDNETRGGVIQLAAGGEFMGGDQNFAYRGKCRVDGSALTGSIDILRHSEAAEPRTVFGTDETGYSAACVAEAITPDLFEGRLCRAGHPDIRVVLRRLTFGHA